MCLLYEGKDPLLRNKNQMERINSYVEKVKSNQYRLWKNGKPLLTTLDIELTERCNNNCIHCYINQPADDRDVLHKEMKTDEIKRIIAEAASLGCLTIKFTGGEPLLREDFEDVYTYTRKLGIKVFLFTNATLITRRLADLFAKMPPRETIEITYYGMRQSSYEAVSRAPDSYEAANRGINLLLKKKIPFALKNALLPPVMHEVDEFESWASQLPGLNQKPTFTVSLNLRCRRDSDKKNSTIKDMRLSPDETIKLFARNRDGYLNDMKQFCLKFMGTGGRRLFTCGAGLRGGTVDAYGRFQLCLLLRHPETVYNLRDGCLREALTSFSNNVRNLEAQNPEYLRRCARCFLKGLCGQCPGASWIEHGTLDTPVEYLCEVAHAKAFFLGLVSKKEKAWEVDTKGNNQGKDQGKPFINKKIGRWK